MGKYRIEKSELHKKNLGKHTLTDKLAYTGQITFGYATNVFHYTSPEGLMGILKNREIFFTDAQYLNDYKERLSINDELKRFWEENYNKYDKCFYQLFKGIHVVLFCKLDDAPLVRLNDGVSAWIERSYAN